MKLKGKEGITLIALVVTIIVLMILAGVSIKLMFGQYGIVTRAKEAKEQMEIAQLKEDIQLKLVDIQAQKVLTGGNITTSELEATIIVAGGEAIKNASGEITGVKVGDTTIPIEEVTQGITIETGSGTETLTWTWTDSDTSGTKNIGDVVTDSSGESFYIISTEGDNYALLAAKNINTSTLLQSDDANTVAFCTDPDSTCEGYWTSIEGITYPYDLNNVESERATAINYAKAYGTAKGGTGRLLTYDEANTLENSNSSMIYGTETTAGYLSYWLDAASNTYSVYFMGGGLNCNYFDYEDSYGVRPVIEISKSLILS